MINGMRTNSFSIIKNLNLNYSQFNLVSVSIVEKLNVVNKTFGFLQIHSYLIINDHSKDKRKKIEAVILL
jgi:hypothetical protein